MSRRFWNKPSTGSNVDDELKNSNYKSIITIREDSSSSSSSCPLFASLLPPSSLSSSSSMLSITSSFSLDLQRQLLPIFKHRCQILYAIEKFSLVIICGETGSGKSTQLSQYLYENGWCDEGFSICITQPRRIAAQTLAERVSQEMGCTKVGDIVGYSVRFDDVKSPSTVIHYVTDGMLLREAMLIDPLLSRYSVIILDEVHERSLQTDILLAVLKKIRRKRLDLRIIICSATMDADSFFEYFMGYKYDYNTSQGGLDHDRQGVSRDNKVSSSSSSSRSSSSIPNKGNIQEGTILSIDGRQYPVETYYIDQPVSDYIQATVDTVLHLHMEGGKDNGDILCFLPSGEDVDQAVLLASDNWTTMFQDSKKKGIIALEFLPLYSTLPKQLQMNVFKSQENTSKTRRVIFSTNIAETSVTVPNISVVVDCGFAKIPFFDPITGFDRLIVCPISQASARQRAGRAGRLKNGKCFRLYTEGSMSKVMDISTSPEILRSNLTSFLLTLKALGVQNILSFDLMNRPSIPTLCHGLETLYALGAIDDEANLTKLGDKMAEFPASPNESKMMLESLQLGCSREMVCVGAALQVKSLFYQPKNPRQKIEYDKAMNEIIDHSSDHVTYLNLMEINDSTRYNEDECRARFINYHALQRIDDVRSQLALHLRRYGRLEGNTGVGNSERSALIRKCVTAGFFTNVAKLGHDGKYYSLRGKAQVSVSSASVLERFGTPSEYILYGETYDGSRGGIEVRHCSNIEAKWLRDVAPHYWG